MVMTYGEMLREALREIERCDAWALLTFLLKKDRAAVACMLRDTAPSEVYNAYRELVSKRRLGMPVAYITGIKEFFSLEFRVCEGVLIPRPDTETLVLWAIERATGKTVLDLCCGSGCIGIAVAVNAPCRLTLADVSKTALETARLNAADHKIDADFAAIDILNDEITGSYDMILSNPPYIESEVIGTLDRDIWAFEPHLALDGGTNGLDFYPVIAKKACRALNRGGMLAVEIGYDQASAVSKIFEPLYDDVSVLKDLAGNDRVVLGTKKQ